MFELHPKLFVDTVPVAEWPLSCVLLMNERSYPWLILVPRRAGISEIGELEAADRAVLIEEIARLSDVVRARLSPDRINVAALGNVVPQLHVHVIARFKTDPAWPRPVWGAQPVVPFSDGELDRHAEEWSSLLR
ncbi:HIT domain-containing protein [Magnetospirillum fulvum]|uniref:Diadenosine tetraphosphate (Ap4A) hydrolase n=1 Tax=Magnetospirillum fulvum MGU-K5 TaxID=1316936 RepID=S9SDB2_MAGFU|nr:HIT family protein [Magnetospirillum fulvum]EPY02739.1 diadenosine tetraphosphate (Ap4A) hydrolase [Magnetospirillum fulvum MGU-K5]